MSLDSSVGVCDMTDGHVWIRVMAVMLTQTGASTYDPSIHVLVR
jgi:hypothetical protein